MALFDGSERTPLPLAVDLPREAVVLVDGSTLVKVTCQSGPRQPWRLRVTVAPHTAKEWPAARPLPGGPDVGKRHEPCQAELLADGPSFSVGLTAGDVFVDTGFRRGDVGIAPHVDEDGKVIE